MAEGVLEVPRIANVFLFFFLSFFFRGTRLHSADGDVLTVPVEGAWKICVRNPIPICINSAFSGRKSPRFKEPRTEGAIKGPWREGSKLFGSTDVKLVHLTNFGLSRAALDYGSKRQVSGLWSWTMKAIETIK